MQAGAVLDFVLAEIGPSVYNLALRDAQARLRDAVADLDVALGEPEFAHTTALRTASNRRRAPRRRRATGLWRGRRFGASCSTFTHRQRAMKPVVMLLALASATPTLAQTAPLAAPEPLVWQAGVDGGFEALPLWLGGGAHVSAGRRLAVRLGADASAEFTLGADPTTVYAVDLSPGVRASAGRLHVAAFAGPSVVWGLGRFERGRLGPSRQPYTTLGLALNGSAVVDVGKGIGLGVGVSGNVNPDVSRGGARLALHLGLDGLR